MPFDGNRWNLGKFVPYRKMLAAVLARYPDLQRVADGPNNTSKVGQSILFNAWFALPTTPAVSTLFFLPPHPSSQTYQVPGYKGHVGFITSMSEHFCGSCNRLRLTADGNLKVRQ